MSKLETTIGHLQYRDLKNKENILELYLTEENKDKDLCLKDFIRTLKIYLETGEKK